jgi:opacity protein-like surface antigen
MHRLLSLLIAALTFSANVYAQPQEGAIVSGMVGAVAANSDTDVAISVSAGYRFNRVFGLGVELTSVPSLSSDLTFLPIYAPQDVNGSMTVFTTNVRLEVPTTTPRVVPYAAAGGGVANLKQHFGVVIAYDIVPELRQVLPVPVPQIYPTPRLQLFSTTELALTAGGGVSILFGRHVSADVDLRYLRLIGDQDRNIGRFGAGVSYRF